MIKYVTFFLLSFSVALVACGGAENEAREAANEVSAAANDVGNDISNGASDMMNKASGAMAGMTSINETVSAVKNAGGDITALSPDVAVGNIDSWIGKLNGVDGSGEVVENLKDLKEELMGDRDGQKIGTLLNALAEDSREMAPNNAALNGLASALEAGGKKLGGM